MAQYKVPQDVEAEDKLLGPFTFRQFIYLMIAGGLIAVGFLLFKIFPLLCIIPVPPVLLLLVLALPIKKDQPMETYLSAIVTYYLKPHTRVWEPGEPESAIIINAPKQKEENRVKNISEEEASHRLSFLADIVDTEGYAIKGAAQGTQIRDEIYAEANNAEDMFDTSTSAINQTLEANTVSRHDQLVNQMREAIEKSHNMAPTDVKIEKFQETKSVLAEPAITSNHVVQPMQVQPTQTQSIPAPQSTMPMQTSSSEQPISFAKLPTPGSIIKPTSENTPPPLPDPAKDIFDNPAVIQPIVEIPKPTEQKPASTSEKPVNPDIIDLANNNDFSIQTIAKEANRINEKNNDGEVYISLH